MTRRTRHRLRVALMVVFCLLFQQMALAAYLCPQESEPAAPVATAGHCDDMDMEQVREDPGLCDKHCNPDRVVVVEAAKLSVPPLALPPPDMTLATVVPREHVALRVDVSAGWVRPPPRLLFCTLLI
jgi:hypothetical protein